MTPTAAHAGTRPILFVCNKANECGFTDCPDAVPHPENVFCEPGPCYRWMQVKGIGAVMALCECVAEIVEEE